MDHPFNSTKGLSHRCEALFLLAAGGWRRVNALCCRCCAKSGCIMCRNLENFAASDKERRYLRRHSHFQISPVCCRYRAAPYHPRTPDRFRLSIRQLNQEIDRRRARALNRHDERSDFFFGSWTKRHEEFSLFKFDLFNMFRYHFRKQRAMPYVFHKFAASNGGDDGGRRLFRRKRSILRFNKATAISEVLDRLSADRKQRLYRFLHTHAGNSTTPAYLAVRFRNSH